MNIVLLCPILQFVGRKMFTRVSGLVAFIVFVKIKMYNFSIILLIFLDGSEMMLFLLEGWMAMMVF